jgi:O-antigen ligase
MLALFMLAPNMPRPSVIFPFLLGISSLHFFIAVQQDFRASLRGNEERWFLVTLFGFTGYLLLNSMWSLATQAALGKTVFVFLIILLSLLTSRAFSRLSSETLQRVANYAVIGAIIGTLIICFEFSTGHMLGRTLYTWFPAIRPGAKTINVMVNIDGALKPLAEPEFRKAYGKVVIRVSSAALNRNLSLLMLLFWPALFLAVNFTKTKLAPFAAPVIAVAAAIAIFLGHSQTAQIALVLSACVFFISKYWPSVTHRVILSAWCIAVILALPLSSAPYKYGLHTSEAISTSFRDRMIIWDTTVEQARKTPFLGIGIRSTRVLGKEFVKTQTKLPGHIVPRRLGLHTHNQYLQVWFELGAVGALFVLAIGIGMLRAIKSTGETARPYAYAAFAAACIVAAFGWGLWQTWLLSGYALSVILVRFMEEISGRPKQGDV